MKKYCVLLLALFINPDFSSAEEAQNPLQPRIVGGRNATQNEFPFVVAFIFEGVPECTGTIINPLKVLTAAHCMNGTKYDEWVLKAGFHVWNDPNAVVRYISSVRIHRNFFGQRYWPFDIALVDVTQPFEFNAAVQPVVLPKFRQKLRVGTQATFIGWGFIQFRPKIALPSVLQALEVVTITKRRCSQSWTGLQRQICAYGPTGFEDSCYGDSGGPMMVGNVQWGLLALGAKNCTGVKPLTFLEVSRFRKWINRFSRIPGQKN
ncbi:chymotrypsin-1-like [Periplaneta americana]|uniref:chymotrypsin-1-like n=1 Tax=Periplaneta americana TaxID=6978 RepID=UPI0037E9C499